MKGGIRSTGSPLLTIPEWARPLGNPVKRYSVPRTVAQSSSLPILDCEEGAARRSQNGERVVMSCRLCQSTNGATFPSEINIHFPGRENLDKKTVWAFPKLTVCLDCGFAEFRLEDGELSGLAEPTAQTAVEQPLKNTLS